MCGWLAAIAAMPPTAATLVGQPVVDVAGGIPEQVADGVWTSSARWPMPTRRA